MRVFIIHGSFGSPDENWFPWLKEKLELQDCEVTIPTFPTPENQNLESWNQVFDQYLEKLDENTVLIGHSLGCAFALNILEKLDRPIRGVFLVSSFIELLGSSDFDEVNQTFVDRDFDWENITKNSKNLLCTTEKMIPTCHSKRARE